MEMTANSLTQERLKELLAYDEDTGALIRVKSAGNGGRWKKGTVIGHADKDGYIVTYFQGRNYKVHHLVWMYHNGVMPEMIDHINRVAGDNRIENLRLTNKRENAINSKIQKNNTSGAKGISWNSKLNKWEVYIHFQRKKKGLGYFSSMEDALAARKAAESNMWEYAELL